MEAAGTTTHGPHWRRNQIAITVASFIGFTSFTLVMPFLPLYFEELGLHDTSAIAIWSGLSLGVTPAITAAMAPIWARVADRYGRKLMVVVPVGGDALPAALPHRDAFVGVVEEPTQRRGDLSGLRGHLFGRLRAG